jgi:endoglucanase
MYCIIDIHHDTGNAGWLKSSPDNFAANHDRAAYLIRQIASRYRDKSSRLILEGFNEMVDNETRWGNVPAENLEIMNRWNQLFVDTVRATGGRNTDRYLLVNTYSAGSGQEFLDAFRLPADSVSDRIYVGVHAYAGYSDLDDTFARLAGFCSRYSVVDGEWGSFGGGNTGVTDAAFASEYVRRSAAIGMSSILWDDGSEKGSYHTINRAGNTWAKKDVADAIVSNAY